MSAGNAGSTGGNTNQVSGYEAVKSKEKNSKNNKGANVNTYSSQKTSTQKDKERAEGNVEMGLGTPSKLADYNPEKDDSGVKQSIENAKKNKNTVAYGGGNNGGGGNNTITQVTQTAPTVAEVDQVTTDTTPTETAETTEANRLLKIKKKGRSRSIMTSAKGVTKTSSDYSLGKPSLLGRV